jgi:hypothetical protein
MPDFDSQVSLDELLRELAATAGDASLGVVEARLRLACRARRLRRRFRIGAAGLAACLLVGFGLGWRASNRPTLPPAEASYTGFMALPYAQSDVPIEQPVIVRVDLQPADLEALGLPPASMIGRNRMRADLLIGNDGIARAVRLAQ